MDIYRATSEEHLFSSTQVAFKKDVAFGVPVAHCHSLARPYQFLYRKSIENVKKNCTIMRNMVIEARWELNKNDMGALYLASAAQKLYQISAHFN